MSGNGLGAATLMMMVMMMAVVSAARTVRCMGVVRRTGVVRMRGRRAVRRDASAGH